MKKQITVSRKEFEMQEIPDESPDTSYLEQGEFEDRLNEYRNDDFYFVGIRASVTVQIPHGKDGTKILQTITSPGLWGIESDSGKEYFQSVFAEESEVLADMLKALNVKVTA